MYYKNILTTIFVYNVKIGINTYFNKNKKRRITINLRLSEPQLTYLASRQTTQTMKKTRKPIKM